MQWQDTRLTWDPEQFGGVKELQVHPNTIWKPDVTAYNSADGRHQFSDFMGSQVMAMLYSDGKCKWVPQVQFTTSCSMKSYYFPFDLQQCVLKIGSWVHSKSFMKFKLADRKVTYDNFVQKNNWFLLDSVAVIKDETYRVFTGS